MLSVSSVSMHFGGVNVLQDVNFEVADRSICGLIGPNGAGKTTLFNIITGLVRPSGGQVTLDDHSVIGLKPHVITRLGVARTFQNIHLFREMTLLQNVVVGAYRNIGYGPLDLFLRPGRVRRCEQAAQKRAEELLALVKLDQRANEVADNLSYGEQRRLELARALATEPRLLLLDEPAAGMNSGERVDLMNTIRSIRQHDYTILVVEHDIKFVVGICDKVLALNFGRIIAQGDPDTVRRDPAVIEAYLGREDEPDAA